MRRNLVVTLNCQFHLIGLLQLNQPGDADRGKSAQSDPNGRGDRLCALAQTPAQSRFI